jgi:hypothetical protein
MAKRVTKPWWPHVIALQLSFWANFISKLPTYASRLSISDEQIDSIVEDEAVFRYLFEYDVTFRIFIKAFMTYRKNLLSGKTPADIGSPPVCPITIVPTNVLSGLLNRLFSFVNLIKANKGYTSAIGKDLRIIGADIAPFVEDDYIANGKAVEGMDGILINFKKGLFIDGMAIFCQRGTDPVFYELIRITKSGFLINSLNLAPGPETRKFKTRAFVGNKLIGKYSPKFSATWTSPLPPTAKKAKEGVTNEETDTKEADNPEGN